VTIVTVFHWLAVMALWVLAAFPLAVLVGTAARKHDIAPSPPAEAEDDGAVSVGRWG